MKIPASLKDGYLTASLEAASLADGRCWCGTHPRDQCVCGLMTCAPSTPCATLTPVSSELRPKTGQ
jgi:hypothetical protein